MNCDRLARVALSMLGRPGMLTVTELVERVGAEAALKLLGDSLREKGIAGPSLEGAASCLAAAAPRGFRFLVPGDDEWPVCLDALDGAEFQRKRDLGPATGLWVCGRGRLDEVVERSIAIVGTRTPSDYGVRMATDIAHSLADAGWSTVSGAAFGIDAAAHRGCLVGGAATVAVLAGGVDLHYPAGNSALLDRIAETGVIVSEVAPGLAGTRARFLIRNRLIAALATGTLIVEAGMRSGARNTIAHARALNRLTMALPGRVDSAMSVGPHLELRANATFVTSAAEILDSVGRIGENLVEHESAPTGVRDTVSGVDALVLEAAPVRTARPSSAIARSAGVEVMEAASALVRLEGLGLVARSEDGWVLTPRGRLPAAATEVGAPPAGARPCG